MPTLIERYEGTKATKTWKLISDKVIAGSVLCQNNLGEKKVFSLKWLAEKVSDGSITENKDGSFQFSRTKTEVSDFE